MLRRRHWSPAIPAGGDLNDLIFEQERHVDDPNEASRAVVDVRSPQSLLKLFGGEERANQQSAARGRARSEGTPAHAGRAARRCRGAQARQGRAAKRAITCRGSARLAPLLGAARRAKQVEAASRSSASPAEQCLDRVNAAGSTGTECLIPRRPPSTADLRPRRPENPRPGVRDPVRRERTPRRRRRARLRSRHRGSHGMLKR